MYMSSRKVGGLAGLGFVATVVTVNIIQGAVGQPMAGASRSECSRSTPTTVASSTSSPARPPSPGSR